ncbi:MAG: hypothetical protein GY928_12250 [Colwellia sp.]|nr:hypothetical protein [Colwellia sp.]
MKQGKYLEDATLLKQGIDILMEKLGPIETSRFLSFPSQKRIESVRSHERWQSQLNKDKFFDEVFGSK